MSYIYTTIDNSYQLEQTFRRFSGRYEEFGYEGIKILYEMLSTQTENSGEPIEIDVIDLCCEYNYYIDIKDYNNEFETKYKTVDELLKNKYGYAVSGLDGFILLNQ